MARFNSRKSASLRPQFPAEIASPSGKHWQSRTNKSVLRDREFPSLDAPDVQTIKNPPPVTPVSKRGSLVSDGGSSKLRSRARSDKGSFPS